MGANVHSRTDDQVAPVQSYVLAGGVFTLFLNTFSIAVRFFVPLWAIAATFLLPISVLQDLLASQVEDPDMFYFLTTPIWLIATYFASFVVVGEVSEVCLGGTASFFKALDRVSVKGVGRLLGTDILTWLVISIEISILLLLSLAANLFHETLIVIVSLTIAVLGIIFIVSMFLFTAQVVVIERLYWFSAMKRSASIVLRAKARSISIALLFLLLVLAFYSVIYLPIFYHDRPSLLQQVASSVLYTAYLPIPNIFLTLAYYFLRRKEGGLSFRELADIRAYEAS